MTITPDDLRALADGLANQNSHAERIAARYAASADMLEVLKALLPEVDAEIEQRQTSGSDEYWLGLKALSDTARAAIVKAERAEP